MRIVWVLVIVLVADALKKRCERYPQCTPLARQLLDVQYTGLTTGVITDEQISPHENEARFTGKLKGLRNNKPIEADFSLRVVEESGKWRISFSVNSGVGLIPTQRPATKACAESGAALSVVQV